MPSVSIPLFPDTSTPLRLPLHKFRDTSALLRLVELHCIYGYKLSLTATLSLSPTPPASLRCRPASVPLSTRHRLWRVAPQRNLRLLFFLRKLRKRFAITGSSMPCRCSPSSGRREPPISTFLPPIEDVALAIQSVGFPHSSSATHNPTPPSSAPQAPMGDTPMHSLHFGRRPTAYVNFEWPPAHGAEGSANSQTASGF